MKPITACTLAFQMPESQHKAKRPCHHLRREKRGPERKGCQPQARPNKATTLEETEELQVFPWEAREEKDVKWGKKSNTFYESDFPNKWSTYRNQIKLRPVNTNQC